MRRRGFTLIELLLVVAIVGVFAGLVLPGLAGGDQGFVRPVESMLEADLKRARSEALASGAPVVAVAAADGSAWWLAPAAQPDRAIAGSRRAFGHGGLAPMKGAHLVVKGSGETDAGDRILATFDTLGCRDENDAGIELRGRDGARLGSWTLAAGRTRLSR
ncbi:MAG: hypothetical protein RL136_7 [Planctomycetota bacterium]|jgi:prepilin-type N-terminal cleavage/methylation domain-containing protein